MSIDIHWVKRPDSILPEHEAARAPNGAIVQIARSLRDDGFMAWGGGVPVFGIIDAQSARRAALDARRSGASFAA